MLSRNSREPVLSTLTCYFFVNLEFFLSAFHESLCFPGNYWIVTLSRNLKAVTANLDFGGSY